MKKQICSLAFVSLLGFGAAMGVAQAQDTPPPQQQGEGQAPHRGMDPNRQLKMLTRQLKLTSEQQSQIQPILTDRQAQMTKLHDDSSLSPEDRRSKMRSIREDSETKIKAVLNDDQKKSYDQMQARMRERMQQRQEQGQENNPGPGSPQ